MPGVDRGLRGQGHAGRALGEAVGAEHRAVVHRLRRRDRGVGVAHRRRGDDAAEQHHLGLHAEEGGVPQHEVGALAGFDRADVLAHPLRDRGVDRVLGDVALHAEIVVVAGLLGQPAALLLHLVGGLPDADDHLADAAHRLAVRRDASRRRRCRGGCPRPRSSPCGCGSRRRPRPRGSRATGGGRPSACRDARRWC